MAKLITQDKVVLMIQPSGKPSGVGTALSPMSIDRHGMTGKTDNTIPGRGQVFGRTSEGRFRVKLAFKEVPGGLNTGTIEYEKIQDVDFLESAASKETVFGMWEMYSPCLRLDNPNGWLAGGRLDYRGRMAVTGLSDGDAPSREATGDPVVSNASVSWEYNIILLPLAITSLTWNDAENTESITDITSLKQAFEEACLAGYQGPDQHLYLATEADTSATANVIYSRNGGGAWAVTSADPFAADEHISQIQSLILNETQFRVLCARLTTDAAAAAEVAYADVSFGAEATTTWTTADVGATNGDVIITLEWIFPGRIYAAVGQPGSEGEVWVSSNNGATWTEVFTGTDAINAFAKGFGEDCEDVYAVGASNLIVREVNQSGTFETLVGPSGGGAFTAIAIANDGLLFAGNGQSIYVSSNAALNTGGWTSLKDFGSAHVVKEIFLPDGDSNHIYVVVDDTTPSGGEFWHSNDGGNSWNQVTEVANVGYNAAVNSSEDPNWFIVVGDANATPLGVIHKVSPSQSGC
jgi:hypothetical protein